MSVLNRKTEPHVPYPPRSPADWVAPGTLPDLAAERRRALEDRKTQNSGAYTALGQRRHKASVEADNSGSSLNTRLRKVFGGDTKDPYYVKELKAVEAKKARVRELAVAHETCGEGGQPVIAILSQIGSFIAHNQRPVEAPKVVPAKGQTIALMRKRLAEIDADLHTAATAPFPSSEVRARVHAEINALAEQGRVGVESVIDHFEGLRWPREMIRLHSEVATEGPPPVVIGSFFDARATFTWLNRDALLATLDREIDDLVDDKQALSLQERRKRKNELVAERLQVERIECELVWQAGTFDFRADSDVRAVLGLQGSLPTDSDQ